MKNLIIILFLLCITFSFAQDTKKFSFGITGGFNYNSNGEYVTNGGFTNITQQFKADKKTGYHGGLYLQYHAGSMYLRPEVLYTKTKSTYNAADFDQTKLEVPVLFGLDLFKPVSIFVGPSFQYILENEFEGFDVDNIDIDNDLSVNLQAGLAIQFHSQIRVDIRYEKGVSDNILTIKDDSNGVLNTLNTKPEQIILSISFRL